MLKLFYVFNYAIFFINKLLCQLGQYDKSSLCRQKRYIDLRTLLGQIRQKLKNNLYRQLGYFDKITLRGQIW